MLAICVTARRPTTVDVVLAVRSAISSETAPRRRLRTRERRRTGNIVSSNVNDNNNSSNSSNSNNRNHYNSRNHRNRLKQVMNVAAPRCSGIEEGIKSRPRARHKGPSRRRRWWPLAEKVISLVRRQRGPPSPRANGRRNTCRKSNTSKCKRPLREEEQTK